MLRSMNRGNSFHYLIYAVALVAFFVSQWRLLRYYWGIWTEPNGYYSHALLVPVLAGIMIYLNKDRLKSIKCTGCWLGIPVLISAVALHLVGVVTVWDFPCGIAMLLMVSGGIISLFGLKVMAVILAPILFLSLMIPVSPSILDSTTHHYQIVSTTMSVHTLSLFDDSVVQAGNVINSANLPQPLIVGGACSGLKLLIALIMTSLFLGYALEGSWWKKAILAGVSFPLSIFINSLRVAILGLAGIWTGSAETVQSFHNYAGYFGLVLCAGVVILLARIMGMRYFRTFQTPSDTSLDESARHRPLASSIAALAILLVAASFGTAEQSLYNLPKGQIARQNIPMSFGKWTGEDIPIEEETAKTLAKGDLLKRVYYDTSGSPEIIVFIDAAIDMSAFHDPVVCIPSNGGRIVEEGLIKIRSPNQTDIPATVLLVADADGSTGLIVYWYELPNGRYVQSLQAMRRHLVTSRFEHLKQTMLGSVSLQSSKPVDIESSQITWYRFSTDAIDRKIDQQRQMQFISDFLVSKSKLETNQDN
ncbi:MAG TPA: exosortase/archaeosortase family protein [Armatimonadota bacterium]|nr:exosortase/archaeosortase family protein [Armatimonadota bacterium]